MNKPIMAKATAVWLVDNTTLSFKQIGDFCGLHELEVQGIADGDVAAGVKGFDPIVNNQLTQEEIDKAEADPLHKLQLKFNPAAVGEEKRRGPRYTPLSKRQDRPASILWLVKFHPGTDRRPDLEARGHHQAHDPVDPRAHALEHLEHPADRPGGAGPVQAERTGRRRAEGEREETARDGEVMTDDERRKLVSTEQSLGMEPEPKMPTAISGLETFSLTDADDEDDDDRPRTSGGRGQPVQPARTRTRMTTTRTTAKDVLGRTAPGR
jgi:hypothetical protein